MTVLSLFDGMSCGQIALRELGVDVNKYYASEIDKFAIAQTQLNFPDTVQLGDIEGWRTWDIDWSSIDLVLAGSPCQGFSFAGKGLAFDDPRSRLFFVFHDILQHIKMHNPNVLWMLENVAMKAEHMAVINSYMGVFPVCINSALVSAQNRVRYYWSNIRTRKEGIFGELHTDISQPEDLNIYIKDILEDDVEDKYYLSASTSQKLLALRKKNDAIKRGFGPVFHNLSDKCTAIRVGGKSYTDLVVIQRPRGQNKGGVFFEKSPTVTFSYFEQNNLIAGTYRTHEDGSGQACISTGQYIRRLTPTECARLQTIPTWYKWECSETQQYKMLGNGWTVEVIKHISNTYKKMKNESKSKSNRRGT